MLRLLLIRTNNIVTLKRRRRRVAPDGLLLLGPHCLQQHLCQRKVTDDLNQCSRCGGCRVSDMLGLCHEYGLRGHLVGGGRRALEKVRQPEIAAVIAVACEKELCDGIMAAFPKPVLAVPNQCPNGPCRDTTVDIAAVRAAIEALLDPRKRTAGLPISESDARSP